MIGFASEKENEKEIKGIIDYFNGISEYLYFDFEFLGYFVDSDDLQTKKENEAKLNAIKEKLN